MRGKYEAKNRKSYLLDSLYFYCQHSGTWLWLRGCVLSGSVRKGFLYELRRQQPSHWLTWMSNTLRMGRSFIFDNNRQRG